MTPESQSRGAEIDFQRVGKALLRWYDRAGRDLPWRGSDDPYAILVSEVMLQQTQVEKVIPFFRRFVAELPDVEALAQAESEAVMGLWRGLGYYRRARSLQEAARRVWRDGAFPRSVEGLRALPGVGKYTAAAIASIAFAVPVVALDANGERVLSRMLALSGNPRRAEGRRVLERAGLKLLSPSRPGDSNQALIEMGALVCRPQAPKCMDCVLSRWCRGRRSGEPTAYPILGERARRRKETWVSIVAEDGDGDDARLLMVRRGEREALLAGLWELPTVAWRGSRERVERELGECYGGEWELQDLVGRVRHAITTRDITIRAYRCLVVSPLSTEREGHWFTARERERVGSSSAVEKILSLPRLQRR